MKLEMAFGLIWFTAVCFSGWLMGRDETRGIGAIIMTIALFSFMAVEFSRGKRKRH